MNTIFQCQRLARLWLSLKSMKTTDEAFAHLDAYFRQDTSIEGTIVHDNVQTYYLVAYYTGEKRLTMTFTMTIQDPHASVPVVHTAFHLTPGTFLAALKSTERFMSLFY